jgi:hypothetical protein
MARAKAFAVCLLVLAVVDAASATPAAFTDPCTTQMMTTSRITCGASVSGGPVRNR